MPKKVRILILAWVGSNNSGDEILIDSLIRKLKRIGGVEIVVSSIRPYDTSEKFGVEAISANNIYSVVRAVMSCDGVIFGGGGLVQDQSSFLNLPYHYSRVVLSMILRKPIIGVGLGIGPLNRKISRFISRIVLRNFRYLAVRDLYSLRLLEEIGVGGAVSTADMAFSLPGSPGDVSREYIGVNLRPAPGGHAFLPASAQRGKEIDHRKIKNIALAINSLSEKLNLPVLFMSFDHDKDTEYMNIVSRYMKCDFKIINVNNNNAVFEMSRCVISISTRYHAGICSILANTPVVLIGYSPKVVELAGLFGESSILVKDNHEEFLNIDKIALSLLEGNPNCMDEIEDVIISERKNDEIIAKFVSEIGR